MRLSAPIYRLKRRAKSMARTERIALSEALDRVARQEGFARWSLLAFRASARIPASLLSQLDDGDLLLIGARPGQGKTRLALALLLDAVREGRRGVFFTLEYTERQARELARELDRADAPAADRLEIATSDDIGADLIVRYLSEAAKGTVAVIDYLQVLDQDRTKPVLSEQMRILKRFAAETGVVLGFISQIDRSFDSAGEAMPRLRDIRLPNPIAEDSFSKTYFVHGGEARLEPVSQARL